VKGLEGYAMKSAMCGGLDAGIYDLKSGTPIELCEMILRIETPDIVWQGE
jgi:hypothetical protein